MSENTEIGWTDSTVNFWWGCTKVGPGCEHCYAETWSARFGENLWGIGVPRRKIKSAAALLHRLDNNYAWWAADCQIGKYHPNSRRRVFVQSMSDIFDTEVPIEWFEEAWGRIEVCDRIDIQILTKRVSVVEKRLSAIGRTSWPQHAGLMISVVNQEESDRDIPRILALKGKLDIPWVGLSIEPMLGPIDLSYIDLPGGYEEIFPLGMPVGREEEGNFPKLDWAIIGGESGHGARPMSNAWAQSIVDQCQTAGIPVFVKQLSSGGSKAIKDIEEFPAGLRVRQFPKVRQ